MTTILHPTNTFNVRASFNKWLKDALANITLPHGVTYTFIDTWPERTMPTPCISVIHADISREPDAMGRVVADGHGVGASGLADISVWVSRRNQNWQAELAILKSAVEAVFAGNTAIAVKNYLTTPSTPTNAYIDQVLAADNTNLIKYHPMNDTSGTSANDYSSANLDGAYNGVTLDAADGPDYLPVPLFADTGDYCDIYSGTFATIFNGSEGTANIWIKASAVAVWTDGVARSILRIADGSTNNQVHILKNSTDNLITWVYNAGGTSESASYNAAGSTDWIMVSITWSAAADQVKYYINGAQQGSASTGLGVWNGTLNSSLVLLGNALKSASQANQWKGYLAHAAIWDTPLSATQIASLYSIQREYAIRIANLDMGDTVADTGNPDIMRSRSLLRYEWTLRTNVS